MSPYSLLIHTSTSVSYTIVCKTYKAATVWLGANVRVKSRVRSNFVVSTNLMTHFHFKEYAELRHILDKAPALQGVASVFSLGVEMIPFLFGEVAENNVFSWNSWKP